MFDFDIMKPLKKFLEDLAQDIYKSAFKFIGDGLFNHEALFGIAKNFYALMIGISSIILVCIALYRVVSAIMSEADQGSEVTVTTIILDSFKSSFFIMLLPILMYFVLNNIVQPIGSWMISEIGSSTGKQVKKVLKSGNIGEALGNGLVMTITFLFVAVAILTFIIKLCIYHADLMMLEVFSIVSAIHLATGDSGHLEVWIKEFMAQITTIIAQLLAMCVIVNIITGSNITYFKFALLIGMCVLLIRGPSFLRSMWYSTGAGSMQKKMATRLMLMSIRKMT